MAVFYDGEGNPRDDGQGERKWSLEDAIYRLNLTPQARIQMLGLLQRADPTGAIYTPEVMEQFSRKAGGFSSSEDTGDLFQSLARITPDTADDAMAAGFRTTPEGRAATADAQQRWQTSQQDSFLEDYPMAAALAFTGAGLAGVGGAGLAGAEGTAAGGAAALSPYELAVAGGAAGPAGFGTLGAGAGAAGASGGSSFLSSLFGGGGGAGASSAGGGMAGFGLGDLSNLVGIAGGLNSLFGGGGAGGGYTSNQGSGAPPAYIPTGQGGADSAWQQALMQMMGQSGQVSGQTNPVFGQAFQNQLGIDPGGYAAAGQQAGQSYGNLSDMSAQLAQLLMGQAGNDMGRQRAVWQAGTDPQQGMYNQQRQQVVDSSRAADSARGLAMSPYSSGNESSALTNFQNQWDYGQLQRMLGANQGANQTGQLVGANLAGAAGFAGQVPQYQMAAGAAPIEGANMAAQFPAGAATQYGQNMQGSSQSLQQIMGQIIPYLNFGQGAQQNAYNAFATDRNYQDQQSASGTNALLTGLKGLNSPGGWLSSMNGSPQPYYGDATMNMGYGAGGAY